VAVGFYSDSGVSNTLTAGSGWTQRANISPAADMELLTDDQVVAAATIPQRHHQHRPQHSLARRHPRLQDRLETSGRGAVAYCSLVFRADRCDVVPRCSQRVIAVGKTALYLALIGGSTHRRTRSGCQATPRQEWFVDRPSGT